ncbi:Methionine adenosyltransferase 2 subunit beta [Ceratocystis fimbriata CBS 114723]|uniref:Methionine adenosyltransferase 2 subunit beta n=1 Tax=Ceratocystis fimbriata CBS 114723 TaxID=1035309 RepID=A0A2C5X2L2_9PEZI|nr:Methionine adenosyltransferase 2 subunit beta [Ceratocystis fimbriata CBS 114723]
MTTDIALITGATGLLGREVFKAFTDGGFETKGLGYSRADGVSILKADLQNPDQITAVLEKVQPKVVVHCAAQRFPDKVDKDPEAARALNVSATASLAAQCAAQGALLIYLSTDYVFPGIQGEAPYEADAVPRPPNVYGQTKRDGEVALLEEYAKSSTDSRAVVLRVPVLYGHAETPAESAVNVLMDTLWKAQQGNKVKMDAWSVRYPTNTEDVARVIKDIAIKYLGTPATEKLPSILQFSSEDRTTKYGICLRFAEIMGMPSDGIEPQTDGGDPNAAVQRPYDCHLSTQALKSLGIRVNTMDFNAWWCRELRAFRGT